MIRKLWRIVGPLIIELQVRASKIHENHKLILLIRNSTWFTEIIINTMNWWKVTNMTRFCHGPTRKTSLDWGVLERKNFWMNMKWLMSISMSDCNKQVKLQPSLEFQSVDFRDNINNVRLMRHTDHQMWYQKFWGTSLTLFPCHDHIIAQEIHQNSPRLLFNPAPADFTKQCGIDFPEKCQYGNLSDDTC